MGLDFECEKCKRKYYTYQDVVDCLKDHQRELAELEKELTKDLSQTRLI